MKIFVVLFNVFILLCLVGKVNVVNADPYWDRQYYPSIAMHNEIETEQFLIDSMEKRTLGPVRPWNALSWGVRYSLSSGVSMQTLVLVLLLPALGTLVTFCRYILGLPTLGMIMPLALAASLLSTGLIWGIGLMVAILLASIGGKYLLKHVRIMYFAKMSMSLLLVSMMVLGIMTLGSLVYIKNSDQLTFLPVLVLIIISERLTALGLNKTLSATLNISLINLVIALIGFFILASVSVQRFVLLYPEAILALIPINIVLGRYFGLRMTELFRFKRLISKYASK